MTILSCIRAFAKDTSGNIAMMFAVTAGSLMTASGVAVDYSRYSNAQAMISSAADAAAIAGAKTRGDATVRERAARDVFESNLRNAGFTGAINANYRNITDNGAPTGYRVEANGAVKSTMGGFLGNPTQNVRTAAQASAKFDEPTEIAFVLDTTDSMEGDRIVNLKSAALGVIDEIQRRTARPDLIRMGVVPFAQYVNVGMDKRNAPWIDVPADYQEPSWDYCRDDRPVTGENNCRMVNYPATPAVPASSCMRDGRPRPCGGSPAQPARTERVCDYTYGPTTRICTREPGAWIRWNGCVGSRNHPLNTQDARYDIRIPGIMGINCATPLLDLTTDITRVRSTISALTTEGETYLPSGLIWGWRMLSQGQPLNAQAAGTRKYMILVTDGRNTKSPSYPKHENSDGAVADQLTRETCANIAADRGNAVRVYTIAFEVDTLGVKEILKNCAERSGGAFFDASNAALLRESFGKIVDNIFTVKLTH